MQESKRARRWLPALAGGAALGAAAIVGLGGHVPSLAAEDKPAEKKAVDGKPDFKPEDVQVGAPPELEALRKAVESAGKKGENVDEIRKQLDALEKALTGRAWVKPKPLPDSVRQGQGRSVPAFPAFPQFPQVPLPDIQMDALEVEGMRKMMEMMMRNPMQGNDALQKMMEQQQQLLRGMGGRLGGVPGLGIGRNIGRVGEGRLGVRLENVPLVLADQLELPAGRGVVVVDVVPGSAADKAGVKPSDILLELDGQAITDDHADLVRRVNEAKTGEKIDLTVLRKGKKETLKVELPEMKRREDILRNFPAVPVRGSSVRIAINNGHFDLATSEDGRSFGVKGEMQDGKPVASEITVTEGGETKTYDSLEAVPAEHRGKIEKLLGKIGGGVRRPKID